MIKSNFSLQEIAKNRIKYNENRINNKKDKESYKSNCKSLGAMIIQNGLYGTLLFYKSKMIKQDKIFYRAVYEDLECFIQNQNIINKDEDILKELENTDKLNMIQDRVLEIISWYSRYADIFILVGDENETDE